MSETLRKLRKLKGRSLTELRVRGRQALTSYAERHGWGEGVRLPTDEEFYARIDGAQLSGGALSPEGWLTHFRTRTTPRFFTAFDDRAATSAELQQRYGAAACAALVERAERIRQGRFDLLGLSQLSFGTPIDWQLEPRAGKRAPRVHWSRINYLDVAVAGDKKIIWELNRHQYFSTLGRAYWQTGNERYAETFAAHLNAWMAANPPKLGINWASSLEVSFRAISWLWAFYFFKDSPALKPAVFLRALKFLYLHARHLETYLSTYFSPNTHLTGEALGLFYLGALLPELRAAARWRKLGYSILLAQLKHHVRPDGVYFEQSSYYHRYTADFYTHLLLLAQANDLPVDVEITSKLSALLDHLMHITRPDGTTPFFGDDDGGRLVSLDERTCNDFRGTLATGAALARRPDYKYVAGAAGTETLWLLGCAGLRTFDQLAAQPPAQTSRAFVDGGYYSLRDSWADTANYLLLDCGPHGSLNAGHAHADALSFELAAHGRTLLVDPGTYTYTGSSELRDSFRSSAAHNTLTIDGHSSSQPAGPFAWRRSAQAQARAWQTHARFDYFEGTHDGYKSSAGCESYTRAVLFLKGDYWIMRDRVEITGTHRYDLHFHFAPDADPCIESAAGVSGISVSAEGAAGLSMFTFGPAGEWRKQQGWVAPCYGERVPAAVCVFSAQGTGPQEFITLMLPRGAHARSPFHVHELAVGGGLGYELRHGRFIDVLLSAAHNGVVWERIASDFALTWARFAADSGRLEELALIDGRHLTLDGQEICNTTEPLAYAVARCAGEQLLLETEREQRRLTLDSRSLSLGALQ